MIEDLVAKVFLTRNLVHIAHWATKSYAQHMALGDLYDALIDDIDAIVEAYQGKKELIKPYLNLPKIPDDLLTHLEDEVDWISKNRNSIAEDCTAIENLIDSLLETYLKALYKLKNLK